MKRGGRKARSQKPEPVLQFAALSSFFSGYLHQDFREEYGSAAGAASAFCEDARPEEIAILCSEWDAWRKRLGDSSLAEIAADIRKLGGAWQPNAFADLDSVGAVFKSPEGIDRA